MLTLQKWHITETRDWTRQTDTDYEREIVFVEAGRRYRVTVYARSDYRPSIFTYAIDDDDTGDSLYDSRIRGRESTVRVNAALIVELSRHLFEAIRGE